MEDLNEVRHLERRQPLFREFCRIRGLHEGDQYSSSDYISWAESLTYAMHCDIQRRYRVPVGEDVQEDRDVSGLLED